MDTGRKELKVDWEHLQRPGFSPDYIDQRYERMDMAFERSDWVPTAAAQALLRNNRPLLAYIGGKPASFTSKDHNFRPGETVEKQLIVINNSRETVTCDCEWSLGLPTGRRQQEGLPSRPASRSASRCVSSCPRRSPPGTYELQATVRFSSGETQKDTFTIHVLPRPPTSRRRTQRSPCSTRRARPPSCCGAWASRFRRWRRARTCRPTTC